MCVCDDIVVSSFVVRLLDVMRVNYDGWCDACVEVKRERKRESEKERRC